MFGICCAKGCHNESTPDGPLQFYRFPLKEPEIVILWVQALNLGDFQPTSNSLVCSEHFSEDSYIDLKRDDVKRYLKRDAVPLKYIISSCPKSEMMTCKQETDADPLVEQADPIGIPSESLLTKIKEEIIDDDTDTVESQIHPLYVKVKTEPEQQAEDTFEFVALDTMPDIPTLLQPSSRDQHKEPPLESLEKFEEITVKEEVDFTSSYCEMCNIKFDYAKQFEEHCILHNKRSTYFCSFCLEIFKTKKGILKHFVKHREIQMLSKCNLCNYTFGSKEDLDMHGKTFKHIKQFSCEECGKKFFLKNNLTIHKRLHTNEIFECNICNQKFARRLFLQNHMVKHQNKKKKKTYRCLKCSFITESQAEITEHHANHAPVFKCRKCDFKAKTYAEVRKHRDIHLVDVLFKCELCPYETHKKYRLTEHQATHYDVKPHQCHICKVRLSTRNSLTRHIKSHTEGNFECELCKKSFNLMKYLKDHMKRHINKDLLECEMCDFKCYKKYDLNKHQIEQNHKKMHKCEMCGKEFTTKHSYKLHLSIHVGNEKYGCIICDERFVLTRQLLQHMKLLHPKAEPLKCDVCDYTTFILAMFEKHKIRHKELKPYVCNICKVGFNYNQSLKKHMASHLGLTPYECTLCDKKYSKQDTLKQHMLSHSRNATAEKSG